MALDSAYANVQSEDEEGLDYDDASLGIGDKAPDYSPERVKKMVREWDRECLRWGTWRTEARMAFAMVAGAQWDDDDKADLIDAMRIPVVFNRAEPIVDAVTGAQIANRQEMAFFPREVGDAQASELIGAAIDAERDSCSAEDCESEASRDALICGIGWIEERLEHDDDPRGSIVWDNCDVFEMCGDAYAKKKNLKDGRYIRRIREMSQEEFREFKDSIGEESNDFAEGKGEGDYDNKVKHVSPENAYEDEDGAGDSDSERKSYEVREYQWKTRHVAEDSDWRISDPTTGQSAVVTAEQYRQIAMQFAQRGMRLQGKALKKVCIYRVYMCNGKVLGQGAHRLPGITSFTYKAITAKRDQANKTWYGLVRALIDPQKFVNKLFSQILNIIDSSAKGGVWHETGAIANIEKFESDYAKVDANIELAPDALKEGRIKSRAEMNFPAGYDKLLSFVWESFPWVTGVNPNLFGMATEAGESGVLDAQRTRQAYGVLQWFFAAIQQYHVEGGKLALELLAHIEPGKLVRIVRGDQKQYVPLAYDGDVAKYDIVVDEAADSPSQKLQVFQIMLQLEPMIKAMGVAMPKEAFVEFLRYSPLPASMSEAFIKSITAPNPEAEKAKALAEADATSKITKTNADAQLSQAKAQTEQFEPQLKQQEMELKLGEMQLQKLEIEARLRELEMKTAADRDKAAADFQKAQLDLESKRTDVEGRRIALDQAKVAASAPPARVAVSQDTSAFENAIAQMAQAVDGQGKMFAQAMAKLGEELGGDRELVRDETGRAVGVRRAQKRAA